MVYQVSKRGIQNFVNNTKNPIYLHPIFAILQFEISSLINWIFSLFQTGILQAAESRKIQFKLGKKIKLIKFDISNWRFAKKQVQMNRRNVHYKKIMVVLGIKDWNMKFKCLLALFANYSRVQKRIEKLVCM